MRGSSRSRVWWIAGGALIVALLGGCVVSDPTPTPGPTKTPGPSATAAPRLPSLIAASPVSSPTAAASARQVMVVAAEDAWGHAMSLTIVDPDRVIATARAATLEEITPVAEGANLPVSSNITAVVGPGEPPGILVVWVGSGCDKSGTVTLFGGSGQIVIAPNLRNGCDTIASYRGLVFTFAIPVESEAVRPVLLPTTLLDA